MRLRKLHPPFFCSHPEPTIRAIIQSAPGAAHWEREGSHEPDLVGDGRRGWRERAHGRHDAPAGRASGGCFLDRKCPGGGGQRAVGASVVRGKLYGLHRGGGNLGDDVSQFDVRELEMLKFHKVCDF